MLKEKLEQLTKEFTILKEKIKTKLQAQDHTITTLTQAKNETVQKLELQVKENTANEQVLTKLLQEFQDLTKELD